MPHVPFAKCSDRPEIVTSDFICLFLWLGNRSLGLSARQVPVAEGPTHRSSCKDETTPGAQTRNWGPGQGSLRQLLRGLTGSLAQLSFYLSAPWLRPHFSSSFANCLTISFWKGNPVNDGSQRKEECGMGKGLSFLVMLVKGMLY